MPLEPRDRFGARSRFPQPIDFLDRAVDRLGGTGLVLLGQAEGHVGPGAGACPGTAQRRGDATGTRRIDSGQTTAESQCIAVRECNWSSPALPQIEDLLGLGRMIGRELDSDLGQRTVAVAGINLRAFGSFCNRATA